MHRITVIYGPPASGKSTKAREILKQYLPEECIETTWENIQASDREISPSIKIVVVDEVPNFFVRLAWEILTASFKQGGVPLRTQPRLVILTQWNADLGRLPGVGYIKMPCGILMSLKRQYNISHRLRLKGVEITTDARAIEVTQEQFDKLGKTARKYCQELHQQYHYTIQLRVPDVHEEHKEIR